MKREFDPKLNWSSTKDDLIDEFYKGFQVIFHQHLFQM